MNGAQCEPQREYLEETRHLQNQPFLRTNDSFPIGIPIPLEPKSPNPNILDPSVTTMTRTSFCGQLYTTLVTGEIEKEVPKINSIIRSRIHNPESDKCSNYLQIIYVLAAM